MNFSTTSPSIFQVTSIKNAKALKLEKNHFYTTLFANILNHSHLKMNLIILKEFPLLKNILKHIFFILDIDLQLLLRNTQLSKLPFLNTKQISNSNL